MIFCIKRGIIALTRYPITLLWVSTTVELDMCLSLDGAIQEPQLNCPIPEHYDVGAAALLPLGVYYSQLPKIVTSIIV
ncbi:hypothetical protein NIES4071_108190 (plasmid) [Calothrix sp. NIES-4071]|nr:hypothetical protein NIES4071_108190 [Calothrix sp. NIES-4071]BAZ64859.1 hypothetical protein NIES4105_105920 [Calothrix sp. NIES-4105]